MENDPKESRRQAIRLFNETWTYLDRNDRTPADDEAMLNSAYASAYFWANAAGGPENRARSQWQLARAWTVMRQPQAAEFHARRCLEICEEHNIHGWDRPFAFEALARAASVAGDAAARDRWLREAKSSLAGVEKKGDLDHLKSELATIPGWSELGR